MACVGRKKLATDRKTRHSWAVRHRLIELFLSVSVVIGAVDAHAHGGGVGRQSTAPLAPGPLKESVDATERQAAAQEVDPEVVAEPLADARRAHERARGALSAGDSRHASMLTKLALDWATTARSLLDAVLLERQAAEQSERAGVAREHVQRARALLAEQQARLGRLEAEVDKLEAQRSSTSDTATTDEKARIDQAVGHKSEDGG